MLGPLLGSSAQGWSRFYVQAGAAARGARSSPCRRHSTTPSFAHPLQDEEYTAAGATIGSTKDAFGQDIVLKIRPPGESSCQPAVCVLRGPTRVQQPMVRPPSCSRPLALMTGHGQPSPQQLCKLRRLRSRAAHSPTRPWPCRCRQGGWPVQGGRPPGVVPLPSAGAWVGGTGAGRAGAKGAGASGVGPGPRRDLPLAAASSAAACAACALLSRRACVPNHTSMCCISLPPCPSPAE